MFVLVNLRTYTRSRLVNTLLLLCASVCGRCPHIRPQKHAKVQIYFFITKSFDKKATATCQLFTFLHLHVANWCAYVRVYISHTCMCALLVNKSRVNLLSICFCLRLAFLSHPSRVMRKWRIAFTADA